MAKLSNTEIALNERVIKSIDYLIDNNIVPSEKELCVQIGIHQSNMNKYRGNERLLPVDSIISLITKFSLFNGHWILSGDGAMLTAEVSEPEQPLSSVFDTREARPLVVTVDNRQREVIPLVPVKARAGYVTGYKDPEYISHLPSYSLPGFTNGTYRMFEVQGYSMYQEVNRSGLRPGDVVVCQYVERAQDIKDGRVYVVVNHEDVLIKRCINRLGSAEKLILKSDNLGGDYPDIVLGPDEIVEVWEFKANITRHVPPPSDTYKMLNNMAAQLAILMDDFNQRKRLE